MKKRLGSAPLLAAAVLFLAAARYQNCEALVNELIRQNKAFTVMPYPNRSHGIFEGENTTRHLCELLTRFLEANLPAGPKK